MYSLCGALTQLQHDLTAGGTILDVTKSYNNVVKECQRAVSMIEATVPLVKPRWCDFTAWAWGGSK